nr:questin oxidase [Quercus suber]
MGVYKSVDTGDMARWPGQVHYPPLFQNVRLPAQHSAAQSRRANRPLEVSMIIRTIRTYRSGLSSCARSDPSCSMPVTARYSKAIGNTTSLRRYHFNSTMAVLDDNSPRSNGSTNGASHDNGVGATASKIHFTSAHLQSGIARLDQNPPGCIDILNELLQKNHVDFGMFWRPTAGHNHTVHSMLSVFALGGGPEQLRRAYDDDDLHQEPMPPVDPDVVKKLGDAKTFMVKMRQLDQYGNFLMFFENEINSKGWSAVVNEYCFDHTEVGQAMLAQLFEGAYHPIIHLGFGVEFDQPSIVAEGLAHAATHDPAGIEKFFIRSEELARTGSVTPMPLVELYKQVRENKKIQTAAKMQQGPVRVRDGVMAEALEDIAAVAAQFQVSPENLELHAVEMISCAAYSAGAAQRSGKASKIDFFLMHDVTSSLFITLLIRQPWITVENKVRLVEWKGRMDLVWYAASSAPALDAKFVASYQASRSKGMDWRSLFKAVNDLHDDGHVSKFMRALKSGEEVSKPFQDGSAASILPVQGDMWFKLAQMAYDSTFGLPDISKWIMGAGFDPLWAKIADVMQTCHSRESSVVSEALRGLRLCVTGVRLQDEIDSFGLRCDESFVDPAILYWVELDLLERVEAWKEMTTLETIACTIIAVLPVEVVNAFCRRRLKNLAIIQEKLLSSSPQPSSRLLVAGPHKT